MATLKTDVYQSDKGHLTLIPCAGFVFANAGIEVDDVLVETLAKRGVKVAKDGSVTVKGEKPVEEPKDELFKLTGTQLRNMASELRVEITNNATKAGIVEAIRAAEKGKK